MLEQIIRSFHVLAKPANLVDFLEDIRELAKLSGIERYFSALGAKRSPKTFVGLGVTAKFVPGVGGSQITQGSFTIFIHKDVMPIRVYMLRGFDLLAGRGNYRHAVLFFYLLVLFGIAIGGISRDHLYIQAHRPAKGDKLGEEKIIVMIRGGHEREQGIIVAAVRINKCQTMQPVADEVF